MKYLKIEYLNLDELIPYENNSRKHSEGQLKQLEKSIKENGFTNPLLVDEENNILAGHGRLLAAKGLGMPTVPCVRIVGLSALQKRAYIIADNKLALNANWDEDLLRKEFEALEAEGFDLEFTGFEAEEIKALFDSDGVGVGAGLADAGIDYREKFAVLVECGGEPEQKQIFERLTGMGFTCKVLVN